MVFSGQDKWRKHPHFTGMARNPFPHFGLAVAIFASYLVIEYSFKLVTSKFLLNQLS